MQKGCAGWCCKWRKGIQVNAWKYEYFPNETHFCNEIIQLKEKKKRKKQNMQLSSTHIHTYLYDLHFWYEVYFISLVNMQCGLRCLTFINNIMLIFFRNDYWKNTKDPQVMSHLRLVPNCSPKKNYLSLYLTDTGCEWYRTEMRRSCALWLALLLGSNIVRIKFRPHKVVYQSAKS